MSKRPTSYEGRHQWSPTTYCEAAGKHAYATRRQARRARRTWHPGAAINEYRCGGCGLWHYGRLPVPVRAGNLARADIGKGIA